MKNILVLCTGNSCRSQIAEGYLKYYAGTKAKVYSAGIETHGVNPLAIETMKEDGVDISNQTSNHVNEYKNVPFEIIITVCDHAKENCPFFPSTARRFHHDFPDPAKATGSKEQVMQEFRNTRELIKSYCKDLIESNFE